MTARRALSTVINARRDNQNARYRERAGWAFIFAGEYAQFFHSGGSAGCGAEPSRRSRWTVLLLHGTDVAETVQVDLPRIACTTLTFRCRDPASQLRLRQLPRGYIRIIAICCAHPDPLFRQRHSAQAAGIISGKYAGSTLQYSFHGIHMANACGAAAPVRCSRSKG